MSISPLVAVDGHRAVDLMYMWEAETAPRTAHSHIEVPWVYSAGDEQLIVARMIGRGLRSMQL
jgi:hypothetical protein